MKSKSPSYNGISFRQNKLSNLKRSLNNSKKSSTKSNKTLQTGRDKNHSGRFKNSNMSGTSPNTILSKLGFKLNTSTGKIRKKPGKSKNLDMSQKYGGYTKGKKSNPYYYFI